LLQTKHLPGNDLLEFLLTLYNAFKYLVY
jgi:hypothetical protein